MSFVGSNWTHTSLCTVCHCWIIDPPQCNLHLSEWTVALLCASPRRNIFFTATAQQFNRHGWNTEAHLICHRVNVLSEFVVFSFIAERATWISWYYIFVDRYEIKYDKDDYVLRVKKASVTDEGTFTCVAENRVGKLEASATLTVRGTKHLCSLFFHVSKHITALREVMDHRGYCTCTPIWDLDWQLTP